MSQQYQCPLCGFTAGSKDSVNGHIRAKVDSTHKGESGANYEINAVDIADSNAGTDSNADSNDTESNQNPSMAGPSADSGDEPANNASTEGTELPCGCESVDTSDVEPPVIIKCDTCGREYPYE